MAYIVKDKKRINYSIEKDKIVFEDGRVAHPSVDNMNIPLAWDLAEPFAPPVVIPPPVIIPPSGQVREISFKDFCKLKDADNEKFIVKAGSYKDQARPENLQNVSFDLSKVQFSLKDGVAIEMIGFCNDVLFNGGFFTGGGYRCIQHKHNPYYDGTDRTMIKNITIQNMVSDNGGSLFGNDGNIDPGKGVKGAIKGFKLLNCTLMNCPTIGNALYLYAAEDFEVSGNFIDTVNTHINNHNGVFGILGNGKLHNNKVINHQGNMMRAQPMQVLGQGKKLEVYGNIAFNSRKYSAFEVQVFDYYKNGGFFRSADVSIHNNTAGRMNISKDWAGMMLDYYDTYGKLEYYNNLGFEMNHGRDTINDDAGISEMINYNAKPDFLRNDGNKYFSKAAQAVQDTINFKSLHTGIGA